MQTHQTDSFTRCSCQLLEKQVGPSPSTSFCPLCSCHTHTRCVALRSRYSHGSGLEVALLVMCLHAPNPWQCLLLQLATPKTAQLQHSAMHQERRCSAYMAPTARIERRWQCPQLAWPSARGRHSQGCQRPQLRMPTARVANSQYCPQSRTLQLASLTASVSHS